VKLLILLLTLLFCFFSCGKDEIAPQQTEISNYVKFDVGDVNYFQEDSIIFSQDIDGTKIDSFRYLVKEIIADSFTINGQINYAIDRFIRIDTLQEWSFNMRFFYIYTSNTLIRQEGNLPVIVLANPINRGFSWSATSLIDETTETFVGGEFIQTFKSWKSRYRSVRASYNSNGFSEPNTVKVEIANSETLIEIRKGEEVYSLGKGLIYRELNVMDTQCGGNPIDCAGINWIDKAEKGFIVKTRRL